MPTADITERELRDVFGVNVFAPFLLAGAFAPRMTTQGGGAIVNIGSISELRASSGSAVYSANKAAIHSFNQSWAEASIVAGLQPDSRVVGNEP